MSVALSDNSRSAAQMDTKKGLASVRWKRMIGSIVAGVLLVTLIPLYQSRISVFTEEPRPAADKATREKTSTNVANVTVVANPRTALPANTVDDAVVLYGLPVGTINAKAVQGSLMNYRKNFRNPCWFQGTVSAAGVRCLPYFYLLGVGKCGSTSVYNNIIQHRDVVVSTKKETFFWSTVSKRKQISKYVQRYSKVGQEMLRQSKHPESYTQKITLDATPGYFTNQGALTSIPGNLNRSSQEPRYTLAHTLYRLFPQTRLIVTMRNPSQRLVSHYHHFRYKRGYSSKDFHDHAKAGIQMMKTCLRKRSLRSCAFDNKLNTKIRQQSRIMLHYGMYYAYAREWLSVFPRSQMFFIKAEDFYANSSKVMDQVFTFLGLDTEHYHLVFPKHKVEHTDAKHPAYKTLMWPQTREMLDDFYRPFNKQLADFLGDSKWLFQ